MGWKKSIRKMVMMTIRIAEMGLAPAILCDFVRVFWGRSDGVGEYFTSDLM